MERVHKDWNQIPKECRVKGMFFFWWRPRQTSWILPKRCVRLVDIDANCLTEETPGSSELKWNMDEWTMDGEKLFKTYLADVKDEGASSLLSVLCLGVKKKTRPSGLADGRFWRRMLPMKKSWKMLLELLSGSICHKVFLGNLGMLWDETCRWCCWFLSHSVVLRGNQ